MSGWVNDTWATAAIGNRGSASWSAVSHADSSTCSVRDRSASQCTVPITSQPAVARRYSAGMKVWRMAA